MRSAEEKTQTGVDPYVDEQGKSARFYTERRDQEEGSELDSHKEVRCFCWSRRDQEEGGGAGPTS